MDKSVKIILGLAIAILFPIFVWFAVYTFIPEPKLNRPEYPKYPEAPNCRDYSSNYSNKYSQNNSNLTIDRDYQYQTDKYDQDLKTHDREVKDYEQVIREYEKQRQQVVVWRAQFALVLAIIGMLAVLASTGVAGLATGLAGGATVTIVIAVSFLIPSLVDDRKLNSELSIILLLIGFILLTGELWYVDRVLYMTGEPSDSDLNGPSFTQYDDGAHASTVNNINPAGLKESVMEKRYCLNSKHQKINQMM